MEAMKTPFQAVQMPRNAGQYRITPSKVKNRLFLALLEQENLSIRAAARLMGISKSQLSNVLANRMELVSAKCWQRIAHFFMIEYHTNTPSLLKSMKKHNCSKIFILDEIKKELCPCDACEGKVK